MSQVQEKHKPITLSLEIDEKERKFVTPTKIQGSLWREAAIIAEEIESGDTIIADLDSYIQFVCNVFGNKFTIDEFENGVDARDLIKIIYAVVIFVMGQVTVASEMLTKNVDLADNNEKKN